MRRAPHAPRSSLRHDRKGATLVEFAIVAPVMMLMLMGLSDLTYQTYAREMLAGAMQKAARDAALQGGATQTAALDDKVLTMLSTIMTKPIASCATTPAANTFCSSRRSYANFSSVAPERFDDDNGNNQRDSNECYDDVNANGNWDAEPGAIGQGGANDVTRYTMAVTYPRLFPIAAMMGWDGNSTIVSETLVKNQPYATQKVAVAKRLCN